MYHFGNDKCFLHDPLWWLKLVTCNMLPYTDKSLDYFLSVTAVRSIRTSTPSSLSLWAWATQPWADWVRPGRWVSVCLSVTVSVGLSVRLSLTVYLSVQQHSPVFSTCPRILGFQTSVNLPCYLCWQKLPSKFKKFYSEFESLMVSSMNHFSPVSTIHPLT